MELAPSHEGLEYVLAHIIQDFMQFMRQTGLSTPQIHVLMLIYHSKNGEIQLSEIVGQSDASKPAASQLVERLVKQGLVERTEDPQDRRNKKLRLTPKSLKMFQYGVTSNHFLMELMQSLPAKHREIVHEAFGYLAQAGQQMKSKHTQKDGKNA